MIFCKDIVSRKGAKKIGRKGISRREQGTLWMFKLNAAFSAPPCETSSFSF
jgi:hypothetical protein